MVTTKYKAKKVVLYTTNGEIKFDSKSEMDYYKYLLELEAKGDIKNIELQPKFVLIPSYVDFNGKKIREIKYIADFKFFDVEANKWIIIDVKGMPTEVAKLKRKMFGYFHKDKELLWVKRKKGEWVYV